MSMIINTADGSVTLRHHLLGELYHSDRGAVSEALHVYIEAALIHYLVNHTDLSHLKIFEVGFGSGLNALLTANLSKDYPHVKFEYHAIELYPLSSDVYTQLNYPDPHELLQSMHQMPWNADSAQYLTENFALQKYNAALEDFDTGALSDFNVIYFDAFAPDSQPELWSEAIFQKFFDILAHSGVMTTYSSKGVVKRAMRAVGFEVYRLTGALGKRHMLRAIKPSMSE